MRLGGTGCAVMRRRLAANFRSVTPLGAAPFVAPQSIRRVAYITPASAAKSSSEPISSEKASRLSRM